MYLPSKYRLEFYGKSDHYKTYFAQSTDTKIIKIGKSKNPLKRVKDLKFFFSLKRIEFNLIGVINRDVEKNLLHFLQDNEEIIHTQGEFYENTKALRKIIKKILNLEFLIYGDTLELTSFPSYIPYKYRS